MDKKSLMAFSKSVETGLLLALKEYVRENDEECTDYHRNVFGLDCEEYDGQRVTKVLNFYDKKGCCFFEPAKFLSDSFKEVEDGELSDSLYDNAICTSYYCLYIVVDGDGMESLHYYRDTNGGVYYDGDQAEPDHGDAKYMPLLDLYFILQTIKQSFKS